MKTEHVGVKTVDGIIAILRIYCREDRLSIEGMTASVDELVVDTRTRSRKVRRFRFHLQDARTHARQILQAITTLPIVKVESAEPRQSR